MCTQSSFSQKMAIMAILESETLQHEPQPFRSNAFLTIKACDTGISLNCILLLHHFNRLYCHQYYTLLAFLSQYPPVSNLSNQASYLRGWQQLFLGTGPKLGKLLHAGGGRQCLPVNSDLGHPLWSAHTGRTQISIFCVVFIEDQPLQCGVVSQHYTLQ